MRGYLALVAALGLTGLASCQSGSAPGPAPAAPAPIDAAAFVDELEERTFRFFWDTTNRANGLTPDRYPTPSFSSIAAVGFALTSYPIGVERGYVTRAQARERVLTTLRFFRDAPQGDAPSGVSGHRGFFYHFLHMSNGHRFENTELSTIDTTLLLAGVLFCQSYFDGSEPEEAEIRALADEIYTRVDWRWAQARPPAVSMGWWPEGGFIDADWLGYNEAMLLYVLALGSPTFPLGPEAWTAWTSAYPRAWGEFQGQTYLAFGPLFGHHYSHAWIDFRGIRDAWMRARGLDYFENSRRATYAHRAYSASNPLRWKGYTEGVWGLSACDGPANAELEYAGERRTFRAYSARGAGLTDVFDDGTLAPSAATGSLPFAPEIVIPALMEMRSRYPHVYSTYGFLASFNPSFEYDVPLQHGRRVPGAGWVAGDYLGIDQGIMLAMIENHRSGLVWRVMRKNPYIRRGLERAGFTGGWLEE